MAPVKVEVLFDGFSKFETGNQFILSNCTCTLVVSDNVRMIVDTMTAWDGERLRAELERRGLTPDDITHVVATHGHSDHVGNLSMFLQAKHIVGTSMNFKEKYYDVLQNGNSLRICENVEVVPTPGHTSCCVSVVVSKTELGTIAITGDLFERREDSEQRSLWEELAGSENPLKQAENRLKVLRVADYIIPGHGPMFKVTAELRELNHETLVRMRKLRCSPSSDESEKE